MVLRPTVFYPNVAILHIAGLSEAALEIEENPTSHLFKRRDAEKTDHRHRLCCACGASGHSTHCAGE
jgi:hypothetical protein